MNYLSSITGDMELDFGSEEADNRMARVIADQEVELPKNAKKKLRPSQFRRVRYETAKGKNRTGFCIGEVTKDGICWFRLRRYPEDERVFLRTKAQIQFIR